MQVGRERKLEDALDNERNQQTKIEEKFNWHLESSR
jgi:hypothetical protein